MLKTPLSVVLLLFISPLLTAANSEFQFVTTLSGSITKASPGQDATLLFPDDIKERFIANKAKQTVSGLNLFGGVQHPLGQYFTGQLGVSLSSLSAMDLTGVVWDDGNPEFDNNLYNYRLKHKFLGLKGVLIAELTKIVKPYVNASFGWGINQSYEFDMHPTNIQTMFDVKYSSYSQFSTAYSLGFGMLVPLDQHLALGLGYEFSELGKSHLINFPDWTVTQRLSLSRMRANSIQLSVSYLIG